MGRKNPLEICRRIASMVTPEGLSLGELSKRSKLNPRTVSRYAKILSLASVQGIEVSSKGRMTIVRRAPGGGGGKGGIVPAEERLLLGLYSANSLDEDNAIALEENRLLLALEESGEAARSRKGWHLTKQGELSARALLRMAGK